MGPKPVLCVQFYLLFQSLVTACSDYTVLLFPSESLSYLPTGHISAFLQSVLLVQIILMVFGIHGLGFGAFLSNFAIMFGGARGFASGASTIPFIQLQGNRVKLMIQEGTSPIRGSSLLVYVTFKLSSPMFERECAFGQVWAWNRDADIQVLSEETKGFFSLLEDKFLLNDF